MHSHLTHLQEYERTLVELLAASKERCEVLPFRIDSRIAQAVIAAAEVVAPADEFILVVAPEEFREAWAETWHKDGERQLTGVEITTVEVLRQEAVWWEKHWGVVVIAGGVDEEDADWVAAGMDTSHVWRMICQPDVYTWPLGEAGRSLYLDNDAPARPFQPSVRGRLSALAGAKRTLVGA